MAACLVTDHLQKGTVLKAVIVGCICCYCGSTRGSPGCIVVAVAMPNDEYNPLIMLKVGLVFVKIVKRVYSSEEGTDKHMTCTLEF